MPLYAYDCLECGEAFETLVMSGETPACPSCKSEALDRQMSLIAPPSRAGEAAPAFAGCEKAAAGLCCGGCQMADA